MAHDLFIVGNVSHDVVSYNNSVRGQFWGGAGLNIALAAYCADGRPKLISVVGSEAKKLLSKLDKYIDTSHILMRRGRTCRFQIAYTEDGTLSNIECDFGVSVHINEYFESLPISPAHYHVCCRTPLNSRSILSKLTRIGCQFSLDFIASSILQQLEQVQMWLPLADTVFLNDKEYLMLLNKVNGNNIKRVVVTSGAKSVRVIENGKVILEQPCPATQFSDVTGAGDVIAGTFLVNDLRGESLPISVERAISKAQASLTNLGVWGLLTK